MSALSAVPDNQHMVSIKYARAGSFNGQQMEANARNANSEGIVGGNPTDILTRYSFKNQTELTLSLPQMGPSFNFYKFRGVHDSLKTKYNEIN